MLRAAASALAQVPARGEEWRVLGAFPTATYLGGPGRAVLPLVASDGLLLPNAWALPVVSAHLPWGGLRSGDPVSVEGDGILRIGVGPHEVVLRSVRTFAPRPVRRVDDGRRIRAGEVDELLDRVGLGDGLTPEADDELCGALLVAFAVGDDRPAARLERALRSTTDLSAALLRCATTGHAVPALTAFVDARVVGDDALAERLAPTVLAIGHSSGPALVRGVDQALASLETKELLRA